MSDHMYICGTQLQVTDRAGSDSADFWIEGLSRSHVIQFQRDTAEAFLREGEIEARGENNTIRHVDWSLGDVWAIVTVLVLDRGRTLLGEFTYTFPAPLLDNALAELEERFQEPGPRLEGWRGRSKKLLGKRS